jgi:hypothetical protein
MGKVDFTRQRQRREGGAVLKFKKKFEFVSASQPLQQTP